MKENNTNKDEFKMGIDVILPIVSGIMRKFWVKGTEQASNCFVVCGKCKPRKEEGNEFS